MPGVGAEGPGALAPPNANATKAPPSGFGADTTKVTAPGVGAKGALPSALPNANAAKAPTSGLAASFCKRSDQNGVYFTRGGRHRPGCATGR